MSDPSVLTELYSWNIQILISRYRQLAMLCLAALGVVYAVGLAQSFRRRERAGKFTGGKREARNPRYRTSLEIPARRRRNAARFCDRHLGAVRFGS